MADGDVDLLDSYRATRWTVSTPAGPVEVRVERSVAGTGLPLPAAIVTAYNPCSELRSRDENEAARNRLETELTRAGLDFLPTLAHGMGPDASNWDEPGALVTGIDSDAAVRLGRRYEQNAIVWIDEDGVPVLVASRPGFAGAAPGATL